MPRSIRLTRILGIAAALTAVGATPLLLAPALAQDATTQDTTAPAATPDPSATATPQDTTAAAPVATPDATQDSTTPEATPMAPATGTDAAAAAPQSPDASTTDASATDSSDTLPAVTGHNAKARQAAQQKLKALGDYTGPLDGTRNADYVTALKAFQTSNSLTATGRLGPKTRAALGL